MKSYNSDALLTSIDVFVNFTLIASFVSFFWRGTWNIIDLYFIPESYELSLWTSFCGGSILLILFTMMQIPLNKYLLPNQYPVLFLITSRVHVYIIGVTQVFQWRGAWGLFDLYLTTDWLNSVLCGCLGIVILSVLGRLSAMSGQPLCLQHDLDQEDYFTVTIIDRKIQDGRDWLWLFLYGLYDAIVCNLLIVVAWRLPWNMSDVYLLPGDPTLSAYTSLFICVTLAFPVILGESMIRNYCRKSEPSNVMRVFKSFVAKCYIMLASCITPTHWRGVWNLQTVLLFPENPTLSAGISHCVGFVGLVICQVTRSSVGGSTFADSDIYDKSVTIYSMSWLKRFKKEKDNKVVDLQEYGGDNKVTVDPRGVDLHEYGGDSKVTVDPRGVDLQEYEADSKVTVAPQGADLQEYEGYSKATVAPREIIFQEYEGVRL